MHYFQVLFQYMSQYLKTRLAYRANIIVEFISDLFQQGMNLLFILVVFDYTHTMNGWTRDEIIFIYGYFLVPFSIFLAFFNIWDFNDRYIVQGEFDRILTRPIHSLYQVLLEKMELESLLGGITGIVIMAISASALNVHFTFIDILLFVPFVIGGVLVYGGIFISLASIGFWSDARSSIMPMMYNIGNYGRYPVDIYSKTVRFVLTWILPFAFVGTYPASFFLDRKEWTQYAMITPFMGILILGLSICLWNVGVRKYRGVGS